VVFLVGGVLTSCAGGDGPDERTYALPETLCGVDVDVSEYEALFPPGERSATDGDILEEGAAADCRVDVDDERAIIVSGFPKKDDFQEMAELGPFDIKLRDGEPVSGEYNALVWPHVAMASSDCTWEGHADGYTLALYSYYPEDDDDSKRVLSELIQPYMRAAVEGAPCV
jgi:hypothetical protein